MAESTQRVVFRYFLLYYNAIIAFIQGGMKTIMG